jgi:ATP-dependent Clp protease ATP-binding subunit ClpB
VLLLDEIEKAHPDVFNLLLQVLDEGRLTDNKGRTINFRNVIIIMTSNLGSDVIRDKMEEFGNSIPHEEEESLKGEILLMLRKFMHPEFLNRIDEIVMFKPLNVEQIREIVVIQVSSLIKMLSSRGISLSVNESVIDWLAERGYDPQLGARPVKRLIQKELVNELSKEIINGKILKEDRITIDVKDGTICFLNENRDGV